MIWTTWWVWALAGAGLAILEVLAPSYIALGFAIGAGAVSLGLLLGVLGGLVDLTGNYGFAVLMCLFAVLSGLSWLALRRVFGPPGEERQTFDHDVND